MTTTARNVITNTLVVEPTLYMVKDCACAKCAGVTKRAPNPEEATRHNRMLEDAKRALVQVEDSIAKNKRTNVASQ